MIDKIEITGNNYNIEEGLRKYTMKRIGKLDRYLPKGSKKDVVVKVVVKGIDKAKAQKYELSAAMEIPGGKVIAAKDESTNVFAGVDILEAKLMGQIRRYKLESTPHLRKNPLQRLFKKRG